MQLRQFVTFTGAMIFAAPAFAQISDRVACNAPYTDVRLSNKGTSDLHQNSPNPFTHQTTISYKLPDKMKEAQLMFYDAQGKLMKAVDITRTAVGGKKCSAWD
jgi:streptogramin lyase